MNESMCNELGYEGQYPVIYSEDGKFYKRVCMGYNEH